MTNKGPHWLKPFVALSSPACRGAKTAPTRTRLSIRRKRGGKGLEGCASSSIRMGQGGEGCICWQRDPRVGGTSIMSRAIGSGEADDRPGVPSLLSREVVDVDTRSGADRTISNTARAIVPDLEYATIEGAAFPRLQRQTDCTHGKFSSFTCSFEDFWYGDGLPADPGDGIAAIAKRSKSQVEDPLPILHFPMPCEISSPAIVFKTVLTLCVDRDNLVTTGVGARISVRRKDLPQSTVIPRRLRIGPSVIAARQKHEGRKIQEHHGGPPCDHFLFAQDSFVRRRGCGQTAQPRCPWVSSLPSSQHTVRIQ